MIGLLSTARSRQDFMINARGRGRTGLEPRMVVSSLQGRIDAFDRLDAEGVTLRRPQPGDYEEWAELRGRSRAFLTPWEPAWSIDELTRAAYKRRLRRYGREVREGLASPFFVFRQADGALVGGCNLNNIRRGVLQACSIGYWVGDPYRRRGYTIAAARAACAHAFDSIQLHRVEAACIPTNEASRALLEKLGFQREGVARSYLKINGVWRDHVLYSLISDDRDPRARP